MRQVQNPNSSISYTNKDFQTIYPELLDLVKKLTYKWDPSISNESDPGVILLKLAAIIGDKNNYNIDKNILEAFPETVTQRSNAVQLFQQLGYMMRWYQGATGNVTLKYSGTDTSSESVTIPQFAQFSNEDGSKIFTSIEQTSVSTDGTYTSVPVIQGSKVEYEIAGEQVIQISNLDDRNRIYFNDTNVAENGIFIYNIDQSGNLGTYVNPDNSQGYYWEKVDNLSTSPYGFHVFSFGVTQDEQTCYVEFPEDINDIIGLGLKIVYVKTDGESGNVALGQVNKIFQIDLSDTNYSSSDFIVINNASILGGADPESIEEAYKNYKKTVGVFKTLVSLRDYINYFTSADYNDSVENADKISNGFVCDNKNDVQFAYYAVENIGGQDQNIYQKYYYNTNKSDTPMQPFDLSLYLLQYKPGFIDSKGEHEYSTDDFNATFDLISDTTRQQYFSDDIKHIQHNFRDITSAEQYLTEDNDYYIISNLCMIKNKFPVRITVFPTSNITNEEKFDIEQNIILNLYEALNSSQMEFGIEPSYDKIYDTIKQADNRIGNIILQDFEYTTYAVMYLKRGGLKYSPSVSIDTFIEIPINVIDSTLIDENLLPEVHIQISDSTVTLSDDLLKSLIQQVGLDIISKSILAGKTQFLMRTTDLAYNLNQTGIQYDNVSLIKNNCSITFQNLNYQTSAIDYTLKPNEQIILTAPNLIDVMSYSNYVKFEAVLGNNAFIPSNTDYELKDGQYLIFYWKSASENNYYNYRLYGKGTIIKSTIQIDNTEHPIMYGGIQRDIYGWSILPQLYENPIDGITSNYPAGVVDDNNYNLTQAISSIYDTILSGTNEIKIREINARNINSENDNNYCYWVKNVTSVENNNEYYVLLKEGDPVTRVEVSEEIKYKFDYELKSGEYFLYTNKANSDLNLLGSGTLITGYVNDAYVSEDVNNSGNYIYKSNSGDTPNIQVEAIDLSEINSNGLNAFEPQDYYIVTNNSIIYEIKVTEQQIVQLGGGSTIELQVNPITDEIPYYDGNVQYFPNDNVIYNNGDRDLQYVCQSTTYAGSWAEASNQWQKSPSVFNSGDTYNKNDLVGYTHSSQVDVYKSLTDSNTDVPTTQNWQKVSTVFSSSSPYSLGDFVTIGTNQLYQCTAISGVMGEFDETQNFWQVLYNQGIVVPTTATLYNSQSFYEQGEYVSYSSSLYFKILPTPFNLSDWQVTQEYDLGNFIIDANPKELQDVSIRYSTDVDKTFVELPNISITDADANWKIREAITLDVGPSKPMSCELDTWAYNTFSASSTYALGDIVRYAQSGDSYGTVYQALETISTAGAFNSSQWTSLNIAYNGVNIIVTYLSQGTSATASIPYTPSIAENGYLLSTPAIQTLLENELDTTMIQSKYGNVIKTYPTLYSYSSSTDSMFDIDRCVVSFASYLSGGSTYYSAITTNFMLPDNTYFIKTQCLNNDSTVYKSDATVLLASMSIVYPLNTSWTTETYNGVTYTGGKLQTSSFPDYIVATPSTTMMTNLCFCVFTSNSVKTLILSDLTPISQTLTSSLPSSLYKSLLENIDELDYDDKFDYTYTVPTNDLVEDPLNALSFFDNNHIYNQFTIAQIDTSAFKIDSPSGQQDNPNVINKVR